MNRINIKKQRAALRRQRIEKAKEIAMLTVGVAIGVFMIFATVWITWIIFGS